MKRNHKRLGMWLLPFFMLLSACNPGRSQEAAPPLPAVTVITPTHPAKAAVATRTPTPPATDTPTPPPTPTPVPTETATPTPWPTLPPDEAAEKVLSLLADNQNPACLLPCWWGATPGETHWQDIEPFLSSFALEIEKSPTGAIVEFSLPTPVALPGLSYYVSYGWDDLGIIRGISVARMNTAGYDPATMMAIYGVPDEVWLRTFSELLPGEVLPFQLVIVYQEKGISFRYYVDATGTFETVTACFEPGAVEVERPDLFPAGPTIRTWTPGQYRTIGEIVRIPAETYLPLEEVTEFTPQTLYEKFTNPDEQPCIDTPADSWRW